VFLPSYFNRRRRKQLEPIQFVPVSKAFDPQIKVRALRDLNGWVNEDRRVKWSIGRNQIGFLNESKAREFEVKGYIEIITGKVIPVSEDEAAEMLSTVTTISMGAG
jgi:hypothetical protein